MLSEAQENPKKMLVEQEKGPSHPAPSQAQITDFQQMVNMLQVERDNLAGDVAGGEVARSTSSCDMLWKLDQTSWWWRSHSCWQKVLCNASVLSASINIEQHGHVKVRSLRQWRPVLSRYGMRGDPRSYVCQAPGALICVSPCGSIWGPFGVQESVDKNQYLHKNQ